MDACDCLSHNVENRDKSQRRLHAGALRSFSHENSTRKPSGVDDWQKMFATIFAANLRHLELSDIAFHLLEEMGEVSDALVRMYTYKQSNFVAGEPLWRQIRLEETLSDVLSWLFALVEKLDSVRHRADDYARCLLLPDVFKGERLLLSRIIWLRYGSDERQKFMCPHCKAPQSCGCRIVLVPPDRSVEDLRGLVDTLPEL